MNTALMNFVESLLSVNFHFTVTSAKRTPKQNDVCNGASDSQHLLGEAIDIQPHGSTSYNLLLEHIRVYSGFDQLILYPTFIHISFGSRNRRQVIDKRK